MDIRRRKPRRGGRSGRAEEGKMEACRKEFVMRTVAMIISSSLGGEVSIS